MSRGFYQPLDFKWRNYPWLTTTPLPLPATFRPFLSANPGVTFSQTQLRAIEANVIVIKQGCIRRMVYQGNSQTLSYIVLDPDGGVSATNFSDFREVLERAADHGHGVLFCYDTKSRKMSMPHILPCRCICDKRDHTRDG